MSSKRISYPPEYRQQIVELYRAGRKFSELVGEFEPSEHVGQAGRFFLLLKLHSFLVAAPPEGLPQATPVR